MRKILISAALASVALTAAAPASAQYYPNNRNYPNYPNNNYGSNYGGGNVDQQLDQITERIRRAQARGMISRGEAARLLRQADQIDRLYDRYRRDGLSRYEVSDIQRRIQYLRQQLRFQRQDGRWEDRRDRHDDRYDDRYDRRDRDDDD
jgi:hypothetical protein